MGWHKHTLSFTAMRGDAREAFKELIRGKEISDYNDEHSIIYDVFSPGGAELFVTHNDRNYVYEFDFKYSISGSRAGVGGVTIRATDKTVVDEELQVARNITDKYRVVGESSSRGQPAIVTLAGGLSLK